MTMMIHEIIEKFKSIRQYNVWKDQILIDKKLENNSRSFSQNFTTSTPAIYCSCICAFIYVLHNVSTIKINNSYFCVNDRLRLMSMSEQFMTKLSSFSFENFE